MYSIPYYPYLEDLKLTRLIRNNCDCEGCEYKHWYGCYDFVFNSIEHKRGKDCDILLFNRGFTLTPKFIQFSYRNKELLWVRVEKFEAGYYYGTIDDTPISKSIRSGQSVKINENRVIDTMNTISSISRF